MKTFLRIPSSLPLAAALLMTLAGLQACGGGGAPLAAAGTGGPAPTEAAPRSVSFDPSLCVAQTGAPYAQTAGIPGTNIMVASADLSASLAGCRVLARGGAAADAAVAVQAVLGVVEPFASGLGGGSVITYYDAATRKVRSFDGLSAAPSFIGGSGTTTITSIYQAAVASDTSCKAGLALGASLSSQQGNTNISGRATGVPGTLKVLDLVHQTTGRKPWNQLWDEAIDLASNGFPMNKYMYSSLYTDGTEFDDETGDPLNAGGVPAWFNSARTAWGAARCNYKDIQARYCDPTDPDQRKPLPIGSKITNPQLANTMALVRDGGAAAFYDPSGPIVASILQRFADDKFKADGITNNCTSSLPTSASYTAATPGTGSLVITPARIPSLMSAADFGNYRAVERKPLVGTRFGTTIYTTPAPLFGGTVVLYSLGVMERKGIQAYAFGSPGFGYLATEASRLANIDRRAMIGDPAYSNVNARVTALLSDAYLDERAALVNGTALATVPVGTNGIPPFVSTDPVEFDPMARLAPAAQPSPAGRSTMLARSRPARHEARLALARHGEPAARQGEDWNTTSSLAIIDGFGNALAMTTTINTHWGAHIEAAGMMLNNAMSNFSASAALNAGLDVNGYMANKRPRSSIAPSIAFDAQGRVRLVWGAAGGGPIPDYVAKTFLGNRVWGMDIQAALNAGNYSGQNGIAEFENGTSMGNLVPSIRSAYGYTSGTITASGLTSGLAGISVDWDSQGRPTYKGAADRRRNGGASGY